MKMKTTLVTVIVFLVIISHFIVVLGKPNTSSVESRYTNSISGLSIKYTQKLFSRYLHSTVSIKRLPYSIRSISLQDSDTYCESVCSQNGNPYCLYLPYPEEEEESLPIFQNMIFDADEIIRKTDIMSTFEVEEDPCHRSDTYLTDSLLLNSGSACYVRSLIDDGFLMYDIKVSMPSTLRAELTKDITSRDKSFFLDFASDSKALDIEFIGDPLTQKDWGGTVNNIYADNSKIRLGGLGEDNRSCLELALQ